MHALVTGATGFLGRYVAEALVARGDTVRALTRGHDAGLAALGVEQVRGDIRDAHAVAAACRGIDVVFHVAGVAGLAGDWSFFHGVNTQGTAHVLAGCRAHAVPRLVFTSSPSVTFAAQDQCGIDERAPYPARWLGRYSHSKALAEQAVLAAHGQQGLAACALRPHLVWGPRDRHLIPRLLSRARAGRLRRVGRGENRIDTIYVENAADAHLAAADALARGSAGGKAYFLSQGEPVNCWDWIQQILALAGLPPVRKSIPYPLAYGLGGLLELAYAVLRLRGEPPMTRFLAAQLATSHHFDLSAARRDLGYAPRISTAVGLERLGAWLRETGGGAAPAAESA